MVATAFALHEGSSIALSQLWRKDDCLSYRLAFAAKAVATMAGLRYKKFYDFSDRKR